MVIISKIGHEQLLLKMSRFCGCILVIWYKRLFLTSHNPFQDYFKYVTSPFCFLCRVFCVKFSCDASYVISGSDDTNLRLWKAKASEQLGVVWTSPLSFFFMGNLSSFWNYYLLFNFLQYLSTMLMMITFKEKCLKWNEMIWLV